MLYKNILAIVIYFLSSICYAGTCDIQITGPGVKEKKLTIDISISDIDIRFRQYVLKRVQYSDDRYIVGHSEDLKTSVSIDSILMIIYGTIDNRINFIGRCIGLGHE
jgi:hypothetical protein